MKPQSLHTDVTIIGGGMVGLALGIALTQAGVNTCIIERENLDDQLVPEFDGRVSAISLGSIRVLSAIGAWNYMQDNAQPIHDIRVVDGYTTAHAHYNYKDVGKEPVGHMVENRHIRIGLVKRAREMNELKLLTSTKVKSITRESQKATVELEDGSIITSGLLVAADGKRSAVRAQAGITAREMGYNQTAIVCTIDHELPHEALALERFLPAGPFAALPMKGNRSAIVWSETPERAKNYMAMDKDAFDAEIAKRLGDYLGKISTTGKRFSYPLFLVLASRYTDTRLALAGDAAHGIHPVAGQGVNVGFRDVAVLAELIEQAKKSGLDVGSESLLKHYERWRRFDISSMSAVTDGITRLFSNDIMPVRLMRDAGLRLVNRIPPLKRLFMRHAMGLLGDIPPLMQEKRSA